MVLDKKGQSSQYVTCNLGKSSADNTCMAHALPVCLKTNRQQQINSHGVNYRNKGMVLFILRKVVNEDGRKTGDEIENEPKSL